MRIEVGVVYCRAEGDAEEMLGLRQVLKIPDPALKRSPAYKMGESDGTVCLLSESGKFYTGLLKFVLAGLKELEVPVEILSHYEEPTPPEWDGDKNLLPGIELRDYQVTCVKKCLLKKRGVIRLPTGSGKSEIMVALSKVLKKRTLVLTNASKLLTQTALRYRKYGIKSVGVIGSLRPKERDTLEEAGVTIWDSSEPEEVYKCKVVVGMVQSLSILIKSGDDDVLKFLRTRELLHLDECHGSSAMTYRIVVSRCPAPYRFGFSGTPFRDTFYANLHPRDLILTGLTGDVILSLSHNYLIERGYIAQPIVYFRSISTPKIQHFNWRWVYKQGIVKNKERNRAIVDSVLRLWNANYKVLVIINHKDHGALLLEALEAKGIKTYFSHGGSAVKEWDKDSKEIVDSELSVNELHDLVDTSERFVLVGTPTYDEGVDLPSMNACVMGAGGKSLRQSLQRPGRVLRPKANNLPVIVLDFNDVLHPFLAKHSKMRRRIYTEVQWKVQDVIGDIPV